MYDELNNNIKIVIKKEDVCVEDEVKEVVNSENM